MLIMACDQYTLRRDLADRKFEESRSWKYSSKKHD